MKKIKNWFKRINNWIKGIQSNDYIKEHELYKKLLDMRKMSDDEFDDKFYYGGWRNEIKENDQNIDNLFKSPSQGIENDISYIRKYFQSQQLREFNDKLKTLSSEHREFEYKKIHEELNSLYKKQEKRKNTIIKIFGIAITILSAISALFSILQYFK